MSSWYNMPEYVMLIASDKIPTGKDAISADPK